MIEYKIITVFEGDIIKTLEKESINGWLVDGIIKATSIPLCRERKVTILLGRERDEEA